MNSLNSICLYCGANSGDGPRFGDAARDFGVTLAKRGITMVYGGGSIGLMGIAADACLASGGKVIGVITQYLMDREVGHRGLTQMHVVETMHQRKALMTELGDGFITLPGGFGTLDELFDSLTLLQLNQHTKPIGLLNVAGFYDSLVAFLAHARDTRFLREVHYNALHVDATTDALIDRMAHAEVPHIDKWLPKLTP